MSPRPNWRTDPPPPRGARIAAWIFVLYVVGGVAGQIVYHAGVAWGWWTG